MHIPRVVLADSVPARGPAISALAAWPQVAPSLDWTISLPELGPAHDADRDQHIRIFSICQVTATLTSFCRRSAASAAAALGSGLVPGVDPGADAGAELEDPRT